MTIRTSRDTSSPEPAEPAPHLVERAEMGMLVAAVAQGLFLGGWLGLFPAAVLRLGGFPPAPPFFVRLAGLFEAVLAVAYLLEWARFRRVSLLVFAKSATAVFLGITWATTGLPALMMIATGVEAAMAGGAALLQGPADRSRRARIKLRLVTPAVRAVPAIGRGQAPGSSS